MAKLHGAKKAAFLRRMAAGRRKAAGKAPKRRIVKRRSVRKTIKHVRRRVSVAKRRRAPARRRSSGGFASKIPLINNPTVRKVAVGIGTATIVAGAIGFVAPSIAANPILKPAVALLTGGPIAAAAQLFIGGGLSQLTGGNGGGTNAGFA